MVNTGISKAKRITAAAMGILLLAVILFSSVYIAAETGHDCTGDDCPICACIQICENAINQIVSGAVNTASTWVPAAFLILSAVLLGCPAVSETLISNKIRLNN